MNSLAPKLDAFITGAAFFMNRLGIPVDFARALVAVVVVAFAMTTLDSGTRILRYNVEEIGRSFKIKILKSRYVASAVAVGAIAYFALMRIGGRPAGFTLWQLFGTTNQLLAGLGLLTITMYLYEKKKPSIFIEIPMFFMLFITLYAMIIKIIQFFSNRNISLLALGVIILFMTIWLIMEALILYFKIHKERIQSKRRHREVFDISSD
jgi:carbon starvation protein